MGFQPYGTFNGVGGERSNRFSDLYADTLWLSHEMRLVDKAAILSNNFVSGSAGFKISYDGSVEFNDVTIRGILEASLFRTASSGTRLEIDGSAGDTFVSFYDGATLTAMLGWEPTGYGADTLSIATLANLDPIVISAAGYIHLTAPGDGGDSVIVSGDGDGAIPGRVFTVTNEAQTTTHLTVWSTGHAEFDTNIRTGGVNFNGYENWSTEYSLNGGGAGIANDNGSYKALMVIGNTSGGGLRLVKVWDLLQVQNNGTAAAPSVQVGSEANGFFRSAANVLTFTAGGVSSWSINSSGSLYSSTGTLLIPDGTAGAPGIRFTSDQNTGMYKVAADKIGFSTAGVVRANISSAGVESNVGIFKGTQYRSKTADGTAYFGTHNGTYWGTQLYLQGNNGTLGKYLRLFMGPGTGNGTTLYERFRIDYNGRMFLSQDGTTSAIETNRYISQQAEAFRFVTASGYVDIGAQNSGYLHIYTDRARFALNKPHTETVYATIATGDYGRYTDYISSGIYNIGAVTSGARFKKNVRAASARNPRALLDTPMREWDWDEEETEAVLGQRHSGKGRGLVADELLLAEPALVALDDAGVPLTIKDGKPMQDMIIETLQHLDARLTALEEQL